MSKPYVTILGKAIRAVARIHGGGSAFPGLAVEHIYPNFIKDTLASLPRGVVVISGTNGKTTTTKIVVELLESQGLKVFTNRSGSNFTRGVAAALLGEVDIKGNLNADIAVLELDEAHAVHFVRSVPPRYSLILNVMRDQLDRFGEIDKTTDLLRAITVSTTDSIVLNREDQRIASLNESLTANQHVSYFGLSDDLLAMFPSDDNIRSNTKRSNAIKASVVLTKLKDNEATFCIGNQKATTFLKLTGLYNVFNAAAALALVTAVLGESANQQTLISAISKITPAFGRGESIIVDGQPLELILVKNPSGFRLGLQSCDPAGYATMIAINDNYADGRDMSWLWDVEFDSLRSSGVDKVSGVRAYDMALRLQYDEVPVTSIEQDLVKALGQFVAKNKKQPKRIYCTYTAMLTLRRELGKLTHVERIG